MRTIAAKDLKEVRQHRAAWVPAVVLPLVIVVVLPLVLVGLPASNVIPEEYLRSDQEALELFVRNMPPGLAAQLEGLDTIQLWVVLAAGYMLAPLFLVLPLMLASIVAADSFVGEKERKTLEALLYTPATDRELLLGKLLAAVIPAVGIAWLSFLVYAVVVNAAGWSIMGRVWFPPPTWWPLILWLAPATAALGMTATVLISMRVSTFMEAYQLSGTLVVLVLALVFGQISGVLFLTVEAVLVVGLGVWLVDAALLWLGIRAFARSELIARL